jgi:beta-glucosidase
VPDNKYKGGFYMSEMPIYKNTDISFEERANDLVGRMTTEEKVSQMLYSAPAIERLGIQSYNWWNECLHGVARAGTATMFPQAIGMAASFDEDMMYKVADIISTEARARYHEFQRKGDHDIYKGLTFWTPNVNIFRDPRWGRGQETYGEDPYLTGRLGVAFIKGLQGNHPKYLKAAACAKHYAVHSGPEKERHSFNAEVSKKDLRETYLPAFRECVVEGKVEAVMGAYNRTNGEPCCGSKTLLQAILRDEWGFDGHVTSDCWAIKDFHLYHKVTSTAPESVALAVSNGCDLNCGNLFGNLLIALKEGLISEDTIDRSVKRLMVTRMRLGMFDAPENVPYTTAPFELNDCREFNNFAEEVARSSLVLLKNKNSILPLNKEKIKSIAVIGPNANSRTALAGNYEGTASRYVTVLEGIQDITGEDIRVYYAQGCHLYKDKLETLAQARDGFAEAAAVAERSDIVVLCLGLDASIEGEEMHESNTYGSGDKYDLNLPGLQQELMEKVYAVGKPVILVLLSGSALAVNWADEHLDVVIQAWYPGAAGGKAVAELIFGKYSPSGRLPVTFYRSTEELPDFCDYSMTNRTYRYHNHDALYPFGYGLSYTSFNYSNPELSSESIEASQILDVKILVKNTGKTEGMEAVQLYIRDDHADVSVPNWSLCGIKKIKLLPGEEKQVCFSITPKQMAIINNEGKRVLEPGSFTVYAGGQQPDKRSKALTGRAVLQRQFAVTGQTTELEY